MAGLDAAGLGDRLQTIVAERGQFLAELLLSPGSPFSILAMAICIVIAAAVTLANRRSGREVRFKVLARALFPRRILGSASGRADLLFAFFNIFIWALLFGWAVLSAGELGQLTEAGLARLFGPAGPTALPGLFCAALMTVALFLAFELGYWINHYLAHKVPFLWAFHKVHHCAESLSPITVFRVHPIYTLVFYNIVAITIGLTQGALSYALGRPVNEIALAGTNVLLLATGIVLGHFQHSHLWISFSGRLGRILCSPAHHQIHHSADPAHYDRNFGGSLALWDHLFGTLHMPTRERQKLTFGIPALDYDPHTIRGGFFVPVAEAARHLASALPRFRMPPSGVMPEEAPR